jgi:hypothetical protein
VEYELRMLTDNDYDMLRLGGSGSFSGTAKDLPEDGRGGILVSGVPICGFLFLITLKLFDRILSE